MVVASWWSSAVQPPRPSNRLLSVGIVLFLLVMMLVIGVGIANYIYNKKRMQAFADFSQTHGFDWYQGDHPVLVQTLNFGSPFSDSSCYTKHVLSRVQGNTKQFLVEAITISESTDSNGNTTRSESSHSAAVLEVPIFLPNLSLGSENFFTRMGSALGIQDLKVEWEEFNQKYRVHSNQPKEANMVLYPKMLEYLMSMPVETWSMQNRFIFLHKNGALDPFEYAEELNKLQKFIELLPPIYVKDYAAQETSFTC